MWQFINPRYLDPEYDPPIEHDRTRRETLDGESVLFVAVDTISSEIYDKFFIEQIAQMDGYFFVYSLTERTSLEKLAKYEKLVIERTEDLDIKNLPIIVIGNKKDRVEWRELTTEEGKYYANSIGAEFVEISALKDSVDELWYNFYRRIRDSRKLPTLREQIIKPKGKCHIS